MTPRSAAGGRRAIEARCRLVLENLTEEVSVYSAVRDAKGEIVDWILVDANARARAAIGEGAIGKSASALFGEPFVSRHLPAAREAMRSRRAATVEATFPPTGRHYHASLLPLDHATLAVAAVDVTELKRAEELRREREPWFRAIVETVPHMLWVGGPGGENVYNNARLLAFTGLSSADLAGVGWQRTLHPDDLPRAIAFWTDAIASGRAGVQVTRVRRHDRSYRWCRVAAEPLHGEHGAIVSWIGTWTDVHEAVVAEEALRDAEARYRQVLDAIPQLVWTCDARGRCDFLSRQWEEYTGVAARRYLGSRWLERLHPDDRAAMRAAWTRATAEGAPIDLLVRIRAHDGAYRWFRTRGVALRDAHGRITKWFGTSTDVDDQIRSEGALAEADRRKAEFLALLSHELRNPLASIRNALHLLDSPGATTEQGAHAKDVVRRQTDHLVRLVDDLLDVTRISRGKIELHRARVDLCEVLRRTCEDLRFTFDERRIALKVEVAPSPAWVHGDETRLAQVAGNLLVNAAKFTPPGGMVTAAVVTRAGRAELRVRDDGPGIPPDQLVHVFEPFAQAKTTKFRAQGGLGLGLALVRSIAELHGGSARAVSGAARGAELVVELPLAPPAGEPPAAPVPAAEAAAPGTAPAALSILVVEDDPDVGESLVDALALEGHRVALAPDGRSAIDLARELRPDAVLCDLALPDMTGHEVARALRADEATRSALLVAVTGHAQAEDREAARAAGFDAHVAKPARIEDLEALLRGGRRA
jgi:PAS domain S-box-containing protein